MAAWTGGRKACRFVPQEVAGSQPVRAAAIQAASRGSGIPNFLMGTAMPSLLQKQQILAVLIDAENMRGALTHKLMLRIACYGVLAVKRAYGDWTRPDMRKLKNFLQRHAIEPVQLFRHAAGKNSADMWLFADAMDLLHEGQIDVFCIVSSASEFPPRAIRIRRAGLRVYGFGAQHTPTAFVQACSRFIYTDSLIGKPSPSHPEALVALTAH